MEKSAFYNNKALITSKPDLNLRKKQTKCNIWNIAFCGAETGTLPKMDHKRLGSFEMWCWRRIVKVSWTDRVRTEEVLHGIKEQKNILHTVK